jgi:hypothetical protein
MEELTARLFEWLDHAGRFAGLGARPRVNAEEWPVDIGVLAIRRIVSFESLS